ncbi:DNA damage-binding protein 1 [Capsicum baccatum]|uniref:DNA damage-binding protein 1 n=1 Tax=Capsicum baccatum TaxID=33114 RepID=A0A2G2XT42_CAPBA|nr:DNA damage-binding protein 1 [Capsicum baccatum]
MLAKDIVKAVKKRLQHKNPKVQLLSLTVQCQIVIEGVETMEPWNFNISYNKLHIAFGAKALTFGIKGVNDHATFPREVYHALNFQRKLLLKLMLSDVPGLELMNSYASHQYKMYTQLVIAVVFLKVPTDKFFQHRLNLKMCNDKIEAEIWIVRPKNLISTGQSLLREKAYGKVDAKRYFLGDHNGVLYLLELTHPKKNVTTPKISQLKGETSIASSISYLAGDLVYIGSSFSDSQINIHPKFEKYSMKVKKCYNNLGPIMEFCVVVDMEKKGQDLIVMCFGGYKDGSLHIVCHGIAMHEEILLSKLFSAGIGLSSIS